MKKNQTLHLIEGTELANLCDYSFGDQASEISQISGYAMREANSDNKEFHLRVIDISAQRNYMTLFIDNLRLYNRFVQVPFEQQARIKKLMQNNDLLQLCSGYPSMYFIIFTSLEDTPIDDSIEGKIPPNVISIHAVNAIYTNNKVFPFPYGIQRRMWRGDIRKEILLYKMTSNIPPKKLLYVNHSIRTNPKVRSGIKELFYDKKWATVIDKKLYYLTFLSDIQNHKFIICPMGNAIDCHRNWEVLYLRRVPVMQKHPYLEKLYENLPVLFVDTFSEITEETLLRNDHLYQQAICFDLRKLDLKNIYAQAISSVA